MGAPLALVCCAGVGLGARFNVAVLGVVSLAVLIAVAMASFDRGASVGWAFVFLIDLDAGYMSGLFLRGATNDFGRGRAAAIAKH